MPTIREQLPDKRLLQQIEQLLARQLAATMEHPGESESGIRESGGGRIFGEIEIENRAQKPRWNLTITIDWSPHTNKYQVSYTYYDFDRSGGDAQRSIEAKQIKPALIVRQAMALVTKARKKVGLAMVQQKHAIIAELIKAKRPDLANAFARHEVTTTNDVHQYKMVWSPGKDTLTIRYQAKKNRNNKGAEKHRFDAGVSYNGAAEIVKERIEDSMQYEG